MMLRRAYLTLAVVLPLMFPISAAAQDAETLADIRQEMSVLYYDIQSLKRELSTTGAPSNGTQGGTLFDRVAVIEEELQRLTAQTEELAYRVRQIVEDGTNRIGDLEFRLVELEGGDLSQLGETTTLGGASGQFGSDTTLGSGTTLTVDGQEWTSDPAPETDASAGDEDDIADLAVGEKLDFEAAEAALADEDFARAAELLDAFNETYPGSPLAPQAHLIRGQAFEGQGNVKDAARAYLDSFVADGTGKTAPTALLRLGAALGALGQTQQACLTLGEVSGRFPVANEVPLAAAEMSKLGCQ